MTSAFQVEPALLHRASPTIGASGTTCPWRSLNNLAGLYRTQGRYAEAESLYQRALVILEKALGLEHPHVAQALENYAMKMDQH